jgi:large subunit ribosomal protein L17
MRHRLKGRKLGRTTAHREAMERNIVTSLFLHGRVITTVTRAKEFRGTAERMITIAKRASSPKLRQLALKRIGSVVQDRRVAKKIVDDVAPRFASRPGGYTRIVKLGGSRWDGDGRGLYAYNRLGDGGLRAFWSLVELKDHDEELRLAGRGKLALVAPKPAKPEDKK